MQLGQTVVAELDVARPVGLVERAPRRADRAGHVVDRAVGRLPGDLFAGRVDHIESRSAGGELQFAVDEHPLFTGQHTGVVLHARHSVSLLFVASWLGRDALPAGGARPQVSKAIANIV